nr:MAG TPA: Dynein heavy chain AAA lid domain [Caudoviricetes sp.]
MMINVIDLLLKNECIWGFGGVCNTNEVSITDTAKSSNTFIF